MVVSFSTNQFLGPNLLPSLQILNSAIEIKVASYRKNDTVIYNILALPVYNRFYCAWDKILSLHFGLHLFIIRWPWINYRKYH